MPVIENEGQKINIDEDGFLVRLEDWTETIAGVLASREGLSDLSEDQLDILRFMRTYYMKYNFYPIVRYVCKNVHQPKNCVTDRFMDPVKAWKIAGLPNPGEEVNMFKSWEPLGF